MTGQHLAGRQIAEVYDVTGKTDLHDALLTGFEASGARVLYTSGQRNAPIYFGVQLDSEERIGLLVYPFRITRNRIRNRPLDEVRGQLRYGAEASWKRDHPIARDVAGVDVTLIVGIDLDDGVFVGLDANLWDPLPMGISFYAKAIDIERARDTTWHVWEKVNRGGTRRVEARSPSNLETVIAFTPDRLVDYARLERRATALRLDPALRYVTAKATQSSSGDSVPVGRHVLEDQFALTSTEILDIIGGRSRLAVAVRGGVAEHHLEQQLRADEDVQHVERLDTDAMHDFNVTLRSGERLKIECKNASPKRHSTGKFRVEVQKTRASKGDPASRFYSAGAFDVVAACLYSPTGLWQFRFGATQEMRRHKDFPDRLAPIQLVDDTWSEDLGNFAKAFLLPYR